jgi:hypothetical protein
MESRGQRLVTVLFPITMKVLHYGFFTNNERLNKVDYMNKDFDDPNVLVVGLNPGQTRNAIGKTILGIHLSLMILTVAPGDSNYFGLAMFTLIIAFGVTSGFQYKFDALNDVLAKRYLIFLRPMEWKILGKVSNLSHAVRRKATTDDGSEPLNSSIDIYFKDGSSFTWSLTYGPSVKYAQQINDFLSSNARAESVVPQNSVPISTPLSKDAQSLEDSVSKNIWEKTPPKPADTSQTNVFMASDKITQKSEPVEKPSSSFWDQ